MSLPGEGYPDFFRVLWLAGAAPVPVRAPAELATLLALGRQLERRLGWVRRHPPAFHKSGVPAPPDS